VLSNQLDPHFIFNTLTGIRYLVSNSPESAKDALMRVSDLLRNNITNTHSNKISLKEEMVFVKNYLDLYKIQLEHRLSWVEKIDPAALECLLPPMVVQMIVENAIKHGISQSVEPGCIHLSINIVENKLAIYLENTVPNLPRASQNNNGIGIKNIRKRLHLTYGENATFNLNLSDQLAKTHLNIPVEIANESNSN